MGLSGNYILSSSPTPVCWCRALSLSTLPRGSGIPSTLAGKGVFNASLLSGGFALAPLSGLQVCQALV